MALSADPTSGDPVRSENVHLWRDLGIDIDPQKARVSQYEGARSEYVAVMQIDHGGRVWVLGIEEERTAERISGPIPLPEWVDEVLFHMGVDEVVRDV